jgi:hypothetical protein
MLDIKSVGGENYTYLKHDDIVPGSCTVSNLSGILTEDIHYTILYPTGYINITQYNKSDIYKADYSFYHCGIEGAAVSLYNSIHDQIVGEAITDGLGNFNISIWAGTFELRCEALDYEKNVNSSFPINTNRTYDIILNKTFEVWGWVFDSDGNPAVDVKAYLYCIDDIPQSKKLIERCRQLLLLQCFPWELHLDKGRCKSRS